MQHASIPDVSELSLPELQSLSGRVAVVTGGAQGIGAAISNRLAEAGAHVAILDLDGTQAEKTAKALSSRHSIDCTGTAVNVLDRNAIAQAAHNSEQLWGRLDIWVNNAGIYPAIPLIEMTDDQWDETLDTNLKGVFIGSQEAAKRMIASGNPGVIINMASVVGLRSSRGPRAHYTASKHGVVGLTKSFAAEFGGHQIRALSIAPGTIFTPGIEAEAKLNPELTAGVQEMGRSFPLGRVGTPDDVARAVLFCASDMSMFMTGNVIVVDAGCDAIM